MLVSTTYGFSNKSNSLQAIHHSFTYSILYVSMTQTTYITAFYKNTSVTLTLLNFHPIKATALFRQKRYQIKILTSFLEIYIHFYSILQTPHDATSNISRYFENPLKIEKKIFGTFIIIFLDKNGKMKMQGPNFFFNF